MGVLARLAKAAGTAVGDGESLRFSMRNFAAIAFFNLFEKALAERQVSNEFIGTSIVGPNFKVSGVLKAPLLPAPNCGSTNLGWRATSLDHDLGRIPCTDQSGATAPIVATGDT